MITKILTRNKLKSLFIFLAITFLLGLGLWVTGFVESIILYKALYFDKWNEYKNPSIDVSFIYPKIGSYFRVATKGWTTVYKCPSDKLVIIGDESQIYSLSICTKPDPEEVRGLLADNSREHREVMLNGKQYTEIATANERKLNIVGRYYISSDHNILIGVGKGSLGDNTQSFYDVLTKIYFKIIGSVETNQKTLNCKIAQPKITFDELRNKLKFEDNIGYPFYKDVVKGTVDNDVKVEKCAEEMSDVPILQFSGQGYELSLSPIHINNEIPYYTAKYVGKMYRIGMLYRIQTLFDEQQKNEKDRFTYYYAGLYSKGTDGMCHFKKGSVRAPCGEIYLNFDDKAQNKSIYVAKCQVDAEALVTKCDKIMLGLIVDRKVGVGN